MMFQINSLLLLFLVYSCNCQNQGIFESIFETFLDNLQFFQEENENQPFPIQPIIVNENNSNLQESNEIVGKPRRRENMLGRRGKLINSLKHGKTSLTRYKNGELYSVEIQPTVDSSSVVTSSSSSSTLDTNPQQFANQILAPNDTSNTIFDSTNVQLEGQDDEDSDDNNTVFGIQSHTYRHLGGIGECRHNFHCIGSESCVNYKGNFM